jgi:hypothetical protein
VCCTCVHTVHSLVIQPLMCRNRGLLSESGLVCVLFLTWRLFALFLTCSLFSFLLSVCSFSDLVSCLFLTPAV